MQPVSTNIQKSNRRILKRFLALTAGAFSVGVAISALVATDKTWVDKSISDLGIDDSAWIFFNGTMVLVGMLSIPVVRELRRNLHNDTLAPDAIQRRPALRYVVDSLVLVPFATMGIGLVPYRVSVTLHNSFALTILVIFALNTLVFSLKHTTNLHNVRRVSAAILTVVVISTLVYGADLLGYVEYEFLLVFLIALWVYLTGIYFPELESRVDS